MRFEWNRPLGVPGAPYLRRWALPIPFLGWSIRVHRWLSDDDHEALHDHPAWFWTLILRGGYRDKYRLRHQDGWDIAHEWLWRWRLRYRPSNHTHAVLDVRPNTWTLCLFGRETRRWSFFPQKGRPMRRDKYFAQIGHHTPSGSRFRVRPDGASIAPTPPPSSSGKGMKMEEVLIGRIAKAAGISRDQARLARAAMPEPPTGGPNYIRRMGYIREACAAMGESVWRLTDAQLEKRLRRLGPRMRLIIDMAKEADRARSPADTKEG